MRFLVLSLLLLATASFKNPESCEIVSQSAESDTLIIFPICGDSSLFIVRTFDREQNIHETIYKNKKRHSITTLHFYFKLTKDGKRQGDPRLICDEFFYQNDSLVEVRSNISSDYQLKYKTIWIGYLSPEMPYMEFNISYYSTGLVKDYALAESRCAIFNGAELDSMNRFIWTGRYFPKIILDTTAEYDSKNRVTTKVISQRCSQRVGTWKKIDFTRKIIESREYKQ